MKDAAGAIENIIEKVTEIHELTSSVGGAIEEQRTANQEIARSAKSASDSAGNAATSMSVVSGAVQQTSQEASSVNSASDMVSEASGSLAEDVERFLADVTKDVEDRRKASRKSNSDDVTLTLQNGRKRTVQLVNVSTTGAQLLDVSDIPIGQSVSLELADGTNLSGAVVRQTGSGVGLEFHEPIEQGHLLLAA